MRRGYYKQPVVGIMSLGLGLPSPLFFRVLVIGCAHACSRVLSKRLVKVFIRRFVRDGGRERGWVFLSQLASDGFFSATPAPVDSAPFVLSYLSPDTTLILCTVGSGAPRATVEAVQRTAVYSSVCLLRVSKIHRVAAFIPVASCFAS